jgi:hypothetical protein
LKYVDEQPEGYGGGSPFATGLDALISSPNNVGQYVKALSLRGSWKEIDLEDFERGRVPDNTMIVNVAIKAAITRASNLETFLYVPVIYESLKLTIKVGN